MRIFLIAFLLVPGFLFSQNYRDHIRKGNDLYKAGKYNDAEVEYRKAQTLKQNADKAEYNLGNSLYKQNKYDEAADKYTDLSGKGLDKKVLSKAMHNLGNSYLEKKEYEKSIDAYKKALINNPNDMDTKYNLEYARRMMAVQQQQQKQQKQKQNQDKNQDKQQQQQQQQNKDDKNKDKKDQKQQQNQDQKISKQDAERILNALKDEEKKVQKDLKKKAAVPVDVNIEKNW